MNSKRVMTNTLAAALLTGLSVPALADYDRGYYRPADRPAVGAKALSVGAYARPGVRHRGVQYDYARVIRSEPILRYVTVKTPVRECWQEVEYVAHNRRVPGVGASTLVGAVIGGVVGHQFGSGRGNDAATVAGTLIGAAIGNNEARRRYGADYRTVEYERPVERCATRVSERTEERIEAYRVTYRYNGQKYVTEMPYDPGREIRVRVDVRPAG